MMSIDVGIKNLSLLVFEPGTSTSTAVTIMADAESGTPLWTILDITPDEFNFTCDHVTRLKRRCGKQSVCKYAASNVSFCNVHKKHADAKAACVHFDRNKVPLDDVYTTLVAKLDAFFRKHVCASEKIHTVIIEKQPPKNPRMRAIMNVLHSYFVIRGKVDHLHGLNLRDTHLIDAKHKLTVYNGPPVDATHLKKKYDQRKFLSVAYTRYMLAAACASKNLAHFEESGTKKDDLADCYLQAVYFCERVYKKKKSCTQNNMRVHYASIDLSKVKKSLVLSDKRLLRARSINLYTLKHLITSGRVTQENLATSPYKQLVETCSKKYLGGVEHAWCSV